jgi:hypothetical protein
MHDQNTPAFETWTREEINKLAYTLHRQLIATTERNAQLRLALREAKLVNELQKDDWK